MDLKIYSLEQANAYWQHIVDFYEKNKIIFFIFTLIEVIKNCSYIFLKCYLKRIPVNCHNYSVPTNISVDFYNYIAEENQKGLPNTTGTTKSSKNIITLSCKGFLLDYF